MLRRNIYPILSVLLAFTLSLPFLGKIWWSPNSYLFGAQGDGLQTYYQSIWHVKNDSTYLHQTSVNYPYGESIFFTGGQPLVSNAVRALKPLVDLSDYMVGVTNLMMLSGILLCALFLYLVLAELKVNRVYALLFAVGITFLSQQWERFGGHYPLALLYAVPGMLYFLLRFYASGKWKWTWAIAAYMLFLLFAHLYYFVFFAAIAIAFWITLVLLNKQRKISMPISLVHLTIHLLLPFVIVNLLVSAGSDVLDRTAIPWGFIVFRSLWPSYLFPYGMWYESFLSFAHPTSSPEWEGMAYIGGAAYIFLVAALVALVFQFKKFILLPSKNENRILLALALGIVFCMAASFAFPFNLGFEELLYKLGPVQQFRGIGRFAFVAFYMIQILLIVLFFRIAFKKTWVKHVIAGAALLLMFSEGYSRVSRVSAQISNERGDALQVNTALAELPEEVSACQAILPLPFIHVGSENLWLTGKEGMINEVYNLSLRTGLPTFACMASRTSVGQTYDLAQMILEPLEASHVLTEITGKPILICADTSVLKGHEKLWVTHCRPAGDWHGLQLYTWNPADFSVYASAFQQDLKESCVMQTDSSIVQPPHCISETGDTSFVLTGTWQSYRSDSIPADWRGKPALVSFWVKNFRRDLIARTTLELVQKNGDEVVQYDAEITGKRLVALVGEDALIEYPIMLKDNAESLTLTWENKLLSGSEMRVDHFLFRPEGHPCCIFDGSRTFYNNRRFP